MPKTMEHLIPPEQPRGGLNHIAKLAKDLAKRLKAGSGGRTAPGVLVGFPGLDAITRGFHPGNLIVLAGRPGTGTKSLGLNWLLGAARYHGASVAIFPLEMNAEEVYHRLLSSYARVDRLALQTGFDAAAGVNLQTARGGLHKFPVFINDQESISVRAIKAKMLDHLTRAAHRIDLLMIDCLDLIGAPEGDRPGGKDRAMRLEENCRGPKRLAKDLGIPVVVITRLNRFPRHSVPKLSDLPGSGAIEAVADIVMLLNSGLAPLLEGREQDRSAGLVIAKHRNGPIGIIPLYFEFECGTFRELLRGGSEHMSLS
jgi:replicative DNA helicase